MSRIELVVFDWDGTLMDSTGAISESIRLAAADMGLPIPSVEAANHVIGLGLADALALAVPSLRREQIPAFTERYRVHYMQRDAMLQPFDGVVAMLDALALAGVPVAIATGKSRLGLNRALDAAGWNGRFRTSRCADEGKPKPHPWMLQDICAELTVAPARTVMIGDTTHDLAMARAAGTRLLGVSYGAHPIAQLRDHEPESIFDSAAQMGDWLLARVAGRANAAAAGRAGDRSGEGGEGGEGGLPFAPRN